MCFRSCQSRLSQIVETRMSALAEVYCMLPSTDGAISQRRILGVGMSSWSIEEVGFGGEEVVQPVLRRETLSWLAAKTSLMSSRGSSVSHH